MNVENKNNVKTTCICCEISPPVCAFIHLCASLPQVMNVSSSCSLVRLSSTSTRTTSQPSPPASCFDWWSQRIGEGGRGDEWRDGEVRMEHVVMETKEIYYYYELREKWSRRRIWMSREGFSRRVAAIRESTIEIQLQETSYFFYFFFRNIGFVHMFKMIWVKNNSNRLKSGGMQHKSSTSSDWIHTNSIIKQHH